MSAAGPFQERSGLGTFAAVPSFRPLLLQTLENPPQQQAPPLTTGPTPRLPSRPPSPWRRPPALAVSRPCAQCSAPCPVPGPPPELPPSGPRGPPERPRPAPREGAWRTRDTCCGRSLRRQRRRRRWPGGGRARASPSSRPGARVGLGRPARPAPPLARPRPCSGSSPGERCARPPVDFATVTAPPHAPSARSAA
ncbi:translation initiation factor IF-2-like [Panthera uncia]|uniref:translation initiation factor IF-2-like n=1 Tax=Panthera uncia TaxID=29064 RepID=UPI0020FFA6AA|nr:translation initiation factor IF-2-like [Panthera uncia]